MLDERSPVPLYYQLQEIIRSRIEGGHWRAGQQLPPEAELCQEFNLSRGTVRQALSDLVRDGLLYRRRGKGSFVAKPKIPQDLLSIAGFTAYANQVIGSELSSRLLGVNTVPASKALAQQLEIPEGADVVEIRRLRLVERQPFFLVSGFVPRSVCPGLESVDFSTKSLLDAVSEKCGMRVSRVDGWFEPVLADEYEASVLDVDQGSPAMLYQRIRYAGDRPLTSSRYIIRGDMCRLTFQVNGMGND